MLSRPDVNFEYFVDEKCVYNTTTNKLEDVIYLIYGREVYDNLLKVDYEDYDIKVSGFVVSPKYSRPNRTWQTLLSTADLLKITWFLLAYKGLMSHFL